MLDAELDGVDAGLATVKTQSLEGVGAEEGEGGSGRADGEEVEEEEHSVLPSTKEERRAAKKKLKEDEKKLKVRRAFFVCFRLFVRTCVRICLSRNAATVEERAPSLWTFFCLSFGNVGVVCIGRYRKVVCAVVCGLGGRRAGAWQVGVGVCSCVYYYCGWGWIQDVVLDDAVELSLSNL